MVIVLIVVISETTSNNNHAHNHNSNDRQLHGTMELDTIGSAGNLRSLLPQLSLVIATSGRSRRALREYRVGVVRTSPLELCFKLSIA